MYLYNTVCIDILKNMRNVNVVIVVNIAFILFIITMHERERTQRGANQNYIRFYSYHYENHHPICICTILCMEVLKIYMQNNNGVIVVNRNGLDEMVHTPPILRLA